MLALFAIGIGVVVGLALGGRLAGLADLGVRRLWLVIAGFACLAVLQLGPEDVRRPPFRVLLLALSYVLVIVFLWMNRARGPIKLIAVGIFLNLVVIIPNGGMMPVSRHATNVVGLPDPAKNRSLLGGKHTVAGPRTVFRPLGDVIPIPLPGIGQAISLGDVLVLAGIAWLVGDAIRHIRSTSAAAAQS